MPISMKLITGMGNTDSFKYMPIAQERSSMAAMTATEAFFPLTSRNSFPVIKPVIMPRNTGRNT